MNKPTVLDLFAGAGGLSLGFELADFDIAAHVENDRHACATLRKNFPNSIVLENDIVSINTSDLLEKVGKIDVIIGGPPCQGFSIAGKSKLRSLGKRYRDPRNKLYQQFVRIVAELSPKAFVMENVPGILRHNGGQTAKKIKEDFESLKYNVNPYTLVASNYGVPQIRKRVFFIGTKKNYVFVEPELSNTDVNVGDAISDLPALRAGKGTDEKVYTKPAKTAYQNMMRENSRIVFNHIARPYSEMDLEIFSLMKQGMKYYQIPNRLKRYRDDAFKDKYRRLFSSKPSWTIMAHLQKDGYMYIHPTQDRTITVREAARLQSFPDRFVFSGPMTQQFKQVGNAVPPLMAKAVALALKNAIEDKKSELLQLLQVR